MDVYSVLHSVRSLHSHLELQTFLEQVERMRHQHQYQLIYLRDEHVVCVEFALVNDFTYRSILRI